MESVAQAVAQAVAGPVATDELSEEELAPFLEGDSVLLQIRCRFVQRLLRCTYTADCPFTFPSPR